MEERVTADMQYLLFAGFPGSITFAVSVSCHNFKKNCAYLKEYGMFNDETKVVLLYKKLLDSWKNRNAAEYADLFTESGNIIGFDGSQVDGRPQIKAHLSEIFNNHKTATYIGIVRQVYPLDSFVWILRAVAGMVPPGQSNINPAVNAVQVLIAMKQGDDEFKIAMFQNTPAAFHGRPALSEQLTNELNAALQNSDQPVNVKE